MLLALVDRLRCTGLHPETWLVARADAVDMGRMVSGVLGCPICRVEREVRGSVVLWTGDAGPEYHTPGADAPDHAVDRDAAIRLGALLGFTESSAPFVICGGEGAAATILAALADAPIILMDPPDDRARSVATIIRCAPAIPLAVGSARGIALDETSDTAERLDSAVRALAKGGRLVGPLSIAVPAGIREIARDHRHWVGEREPDVIALGRATARA